MTLAALHAQLAPSFPVSMQKDLKTTIHVLAHALGCATPEHCHVDQYNRPLSHLYRAVETFLQAQGKSAHTIRNTKNNLSRLFRLAEEHNLFSLMPPITQPRFDPWQRPHRPGTSQHHATYLLYSEWSPDLQNAFTTFQTWATAPLVPGRPAQFRKRQRTIDDYRATFEGYFGYLHYQEHLTPTFDHLFDVESVTRYVHWHVNDCHHKSTVMIRQFLQFLMALTRQYRPMPEIRIQLGHLRKTLPLPVPTYNKADAWVSLAALTEVARSLWPQRQPQQIRLTSNPTGIVGHRHAQHAGWSLMLQLWTYIPYRQRNMREMELGKNLHKDAHGTWRITFQGDELKVATKHGRPNTFDLPFPAKLVPILEEYLAVWHPLLRAKASYPEQEYHVFLGQFGMPYTQKTLHNTLRHVVYRYTGKHWHPHIIRTVWATEWIRNSGDFHTAAIMLNDRLDTVITKYQHLLEEDVAERAYRLIDERNGQGK